MPMRKKRSFPALLSLAAHHRLFSGLDERSLEAFLAGPLCRMGHYDPFEAVFLAGDRVKNIGLVVSGRLRIQRENLNGGIEIVGEAEAGDTFAEAFVCAGVEIMPVSVWAVESTDVLFVDYARILSDSEAGKTDAANALFIRNMLKITVGKLLMLSRKIEVLSKPTTRERLTAYLERFAERDRNGGLVISLNRQELADFLGVNRSALSREIGRMKNEGVLQVSGKDFRMIQ